MSHKIIFYPTVENESNPKLEILKGSHLYLCQKQQSSHFIFPGFSAFDREISQFCDVASYSSSSDEFLVFNTSVAHNVVPDKDVPSVRVIYSFMTNFQYEDGYSNKDHHRILRERYETRKKS